MSTALSYAGRGLRNDDDHSPLRQVTQRNSQRSVHPGAGHGAGRNPANSGASYPQHVLHAKDNISTRPFRPSPLSLYCSSPPSTDSLDRRSEKPMNERRMGPFVCRTILQLERVADEVRAMQANTPPAIPPKNPARHVAKPCTPSPPRRSDSSKSDSSGTVYTSCSSSSSLSEPYHAPVLNGEIPPSWLIARLSQKQLPSDATVAAGKPTVTLTAPQAELPGESEPVLPRNPRWVGLWDGEPDEIQWIEEYGRWSSPSDEQHRDDPGVSSDYDSDAHSAASTIFTTLPDSSSISTSPPTSPTKARPPPSVYDAHSYLLISENSTRPLRVKNKKKACKGRTQQAESSVSRPATWLQRTSSKQSMEDKQDKRREPRKLKKRPSPTQMPSPYVQLVETGHAWGEPGEPWRVPDDASVDAGDDTESLAFSEVPSAGQDDSEEPSDASTWSAESAEARKGWGTLGQWFRRSRS